MSEEEPLSQSQVESLLRQMEQESGDPPSPEDGEDAAEQQTQASAREASVAAGRKDQTLRDRRQRAFDLEAIHYDFKRPERVGKDQMRAMQSLHEGLARSFSASASGILRSMVDVKMISADQLAYSEFVFSLDNPSCFNILRPEPLEGHWILDISPSLCCAVIDRMLGGDPQPTESIRRPLTEIENRLMSRLVAALTAELERIWKNIVELKITVERVESNPQLVQVIPPNEVVVLIGLEVALGRNRGMVSLCMPFNSIETFNSQLSSSGGGGYGKSSATDETRQQVAHFVDDAMVELVVTLAESKIRTGDLLGLAVGDVITTEKARDQPLELAVQSIPKFQVFPGAHRGKKAVRIGDTVKTS